MKKARIYNGKKTISSTSGVGETTHLSANEWNQNNLFNHVQKRNSKWITDLNVRPETILEEKITSTLFDISLRYIFLDLSPQVRRATTGEKKIGLNPTKKILPSQGNHQQSKRQTTEWKKIFSSNISDKGLISNYIKKLYNSISNKQFSVGQNGRIGRHWGHLFPKAHQVTTICGSAFGVKDLKTSRKAFPQLKI